MKIPVIIIGLILAVSFASSQIIISESPESNLGVVIRKPSLQTFLGLTDTPSSYTGQAGNCVKVNGGESALEFGSCGAGGSGDGGRAKRGDGNYLYNDTNVMYFNDTLLNDTIDARATGGGNPFNQSLNTTDNVTFDDLTLSGEWITQQGNFGLAFTDDGSNALLTSDVGGANYLEIGTTGAFIQLYANPNPSSDFLLATITETQGADTELNFYEGGVGHNRFWDSGSARFGGEASSLCSNLTTDVDCDTAGTGADVVVQDDIWAGGKIFAYDWSNVSGTPTYNQTYDNVYKANYSNKANLWDLLDKPTDISYGDLGDVKYNQSLVKGNIFWYNGTNITNLGVPPGVAGLNQLIIDATNNVKWTPTISPPTPTLTYVLGLGDDTDGERIFVTAGDNVTFRDAQIYISSDADAELSLHSDSLTRIYSDFKLSGGDYLIESDTNFGCAVADNDICIRFELAGTGGRESTINITDQAGQNAHSFGVITNLGQDRGDVRHKRNMFLGGYLEVGEAGNSSVSAGDIWAGGIVFAQAFASHSPFIRCSVSDTQNTCKGEILEEGYEAWFNTTPDWRIISRNQLHPDLEDFIYINRQEYLNETAWEIERQICESVDFYGYTSLEEYRMGNRDCTFYPDLADQDCKDTYGEFYFYGRDGCELDAEAECMLGREPYWVWRGEQCMINPMQECRYNGFARNESWNFDNGSCDFYAPYECENRGDGWSWNNNGDYCEYDDDEGLREKWQRCMNAGRCYTWENNQCVYLCG